MRRLLPAPAVELADLGELYELPEAPSVRLGFVAAVDGAVTVGGSSTGLSGPADRLVLRTLRAAADVVLVGAGTARAEDYGPVPLSAALRERRLAQGRPATPALAVVTRSAGHLDPASRLFADPARAPLVLAEQVAGHALPAGVEVVRTATDPGSLLALLRSRGWLRVLCEGGPALAGTLLAAGAVDELCLTVAPLIAGGRSLLPEPLPAAGGRPVRLLSLVEADGALLCRWSLAADGT